MTKAELIDKLSHDTGLTKAKTGLAVNTVLAAISETLKKEGRFVLAGLGGFRVASHGERAARNPQTGAPLVIKAHKVVKFKAAKALKDLVNQ